MAKTMRRASNEYPTAGQPSDELAQIAQLMQQQANGGKKSRKQTPPQQQTWVQKKKKQAGDAAKAQTKKQASAAGASLRSEARSSWHRNRAQLAPWLVSAPFYAAGETALLVAQQPDVTTAAAAGVTAAVSGVGAAIGWRRRLRHRVPTRFARRVQRSLVCGCAWTAAMPLLAPEIGEPSLWAAAVSGTVALSARWWQAHRAGHPDGPERSENHALAQALVQDILEKWHERVTVKGGPLPGAELAHTRDLPVGSEFRITLSTESGITQEGITAKKGLLALKLGKMAGQLKLAADGQDPAVVWLRVTDSEPDGQYPGPEILCNGKPITSRDEIGPGDDVDIVVGPYQDGEGEQTFRVISKGSVHGGFVLGVKGSGKSRVLEILAIGLRWLGIEVWWLDGQAGSSSDALNNHADWAITDIQNGPAQLYNAMRRVITVRQAELKGDASLNNEYTYDPARPPIVTIVDECHVLFNSIDPETGKTYGYLLSELDRVWRKLGMGIIAASQDLDMPTFGGPGTEPLRMALYSGMLVLRFPSQAHTQLMPAEVNAKQVAALPEKGYGIAPFGDRPDMMWRAKNIQDPHGWLTSLPAATLDELAANAAGADYHRRHEQQQEDQQAAQDRLATLRTMSAEDLDRHLAAELNGGTTAGTDSTSNSTDTGNGQGTLLRMPGVVDTTAPAQGGDRLTDRQADLLDLLTAHGPLSTQQMAEHFEVSAVIIRQEINKIGETRLTKVDRGVYRAK